LAQNLRAPRDVRPRGGVRDRDGRLRSLGGRREREDVVAAGGHRSRPVEDATRSERPSVSLRGDVVELGRLGERTRLLLGSRGIDERRLRAGHDLAEALRRDEYSGARRIPRALELADRDDGERADEDQHDDYEGGTPKRRFEGFC